MRRGSIKNQKLKIKEYYNLTKPGIVRGNLITAAAGFLLASAGEIDWLLLLSVLVSIALIIASACVLNNYIDRGIDARMDRTKNRALAAGAIPHHHAFIYAAILSIGGFSLLAATTNTLTVLLGFIAIANYVVFYGIAKRRSIHGTFVGSISGAMPITAGFVAVTNNFDKGAMLLFLALVFWQMPHFYAIAVYRLKDYKAAGLPVLPIVSGLRHTKFQMMIYIVLFISAVTMLTAVGITGKVYLAVAASAGFWWLWEALRGFSLPDNAADNAKWARRVFSVSLVVLTIFSIMISVDYYLP